MDRDFVARLRAALAERYVLGEQTARGGMSVVFRAHDTHVDRDVAVKVLRPELTSGLEAERFHREVEIVASLLHPNILPLFDSGEVDGCLYYVMPFVETESLGDRLEREGRLPFDEAVRITREIADALEYAHGEGVVHRDIKPGNILLVSGHAVVADFGVARALERAGGGITTSGMALGTPAYMSPEQASGEARIDARSDLYSLGCVLFEMLTGEPPFAGRSAQAVVARHMHETPPSVRVVRPEIPEHLDRLIARAMAKTPADRFATAAGLARALDRPSRGRLPIRGPLAVPWVRRVAAAAVVLAIGFAAWWWSRPPPPPLDASRVVVFPLVERNVSRAGIGHEIAVWVETALEQARPLKPIDGWEHLEERTRINAALVDPRERRDITRSRGGRFYLAGIVQGGRDNRSVTLRLYDASGDTVVAQRTARDAEGAGVAFHELAVDAVTALLPSLVDPGRDVDLTHLRDRDPGAIALYLQGEREYRQSRFGEALDLYSRSLEADSALAVAAIKGAQAASWINRPEAADLLAHALVHRDVLPTHHRLLASGLQAYLEGRADAAVDHLDRALAERPDWAEAHMALGEAYYHLLPAGTQLDSLAWESFEAAVEADPEFGPPLVHMIEMELRRGLIGSAERRFSRLLGFAPQVDVVEYLRLMLGCVATGPENVDWSIPRAASAVSVMRAAKSLSAGGRQAPCAARGFRAVMAADDASPAEKGGALLGLRGLLVAAGATDEARTILDSAFASGATFLAHLYVVDALADPRLDAWAANADAGFRERHGARYEGVPLETHYLLGVWKASNGRADELVPHLAALRDAETASPEAAAMAALLEAHLSLAGGDTAVAMAGFRASRIPANRTDVTWFYAPPAPVARLRLAEIHLARGQYREALLEAGDFDHQQPVAFLPFLGASLRVRREAASALGDPSEVDRIAERLRRLESIR